MRQNLLCPVCKGRKTLDIKKVRTGYLFRCTEHGVYLETNESGYKLLMGDEHEMDTCKKDRRNRSI